MNPPRIQWLQVFAEAGRFLSFRKAADALHVTSAAVSQQIKALEDHLGQKLFKRYGPRLEFTEAGKFYWGRVDALIKTYQLDFEAFDQRFNSQSFRLNAPLFVAQELLIPNYLSYQRHAPNVDLRITTGTEYINFDTASTDAAIRFGQGTWRGLDAKLLSKVQIAAVCSPSYLAQHEDLMLKDDRCTGIASDHHVLLTLNESLDEWHFLYPDLTPKDIVVCDSYFSVIKAAEQGIGIALGLFPVINHWINDARLKRVGKPLAQSPSSYWLVAPSEQTQSNSLDACYKWAKGLFEGLPQLAS